MRFLLTTILLFNLVFFLGCKTTTEDQSTVSSSSSQTVEEPEEEIEVGKPQTIIVPTGSLGDISEAKIKILEKTLESQLDDYFDIVPKQLFEEAQEKAFEELDYEECTEEQCIMKIQELLQVENAFQLVLISEEENTQISITWNDLDKKRVEEDYCEGCKTKELRNTIAGLVEKLVGLKESVKKVESVLVEKQNVESDSCKIVCNGLVGYYPFSGNANDISGNYNHGEVYGVSLTKDKKGLSDKAYHINKNGMISIPYDKILSKIAKNSYSISVWINIDKRNIARQMDLVTIYGEKFMHIGLRINHMKLWMSYWYNRSGKIFNVDAGSHNKINPNHDHHIVGIVNREKGEVNIYLDGKKGNTRYFNKNLKPDLNPSSQWGLGRVDLNNFNFPYEGIIDNVRFYNRAIKDKEVKELFNANE